MQRRDQRPEMLVRWRGLLPGKQEDQPVYELHVHPRRRPEVTEPEVEDPRRKVVHGEEVGQLPACQDREGGGLGGRVPDTLLGHSNLGPGRRLLDVLSWNKRW